MKRITLTLTIFLCALVMINKTAYAKNIFVGDSRTVGMNITMDLEKEADVIAKVGKGEQYLESVENKFINAENSNIIINFGVNDLHNIKKYIKQYEFIKDNIPSTSNLVIVSVNPIEYHKSITNDSIEKFNAEVKEWCSTNNIKFIDTYNNIDWDKGFTRDGIHYTNEVYNKIYNYEINELKIYC